MQNYFRDRKTLDFFKDLFNSFTEEDYDIMNKVTHGILWGFPVAIGISHFNSIEAIQKQIDSFDGPMGIIYYAYVKDGNAVVDSKAVEINNVIARRKYQSKQMKKLERG